MPQTNQSPDGFTQEFKREVRSELSWKLMRVVAHDGLSPTQIVRYLSSADRGLSPDDFADIAFRLDATADADNRANTANVTTDERRYVIDPIADRHDFDGLWTGGPVVLDEDRGHKILRQTLTRTFPAGHGYTVNGAGLYVYNASSGREYASASNALRQHRPAVRRIFQSRMAFDPSIPGSFRTEVTWRDFTHESFAKLEALTTEEVRAAIASHSGLDKAASVIAETHCAIDPQTNTVVFTAAGLYKESVAPTSVEQLLTAARIEAPCSRETLRLFGLNELANGEGYRYTHTFRFLDLADTPAVRRFLEFGITDSAIIPSLVPAEYATDSPVLDAQAEDGKGRFFVMTGDVKQAWYRIALMRTDKQEEDGLLSFTIVLQKPEWHGKDTPSARRIMATQNPNGPGMAKETVIPSVPRETAEQVAASAQPDAGQTIVSASVTEGEAGSSDVRLHQAPEWKFDGTETGNPPRVISSFDGKNIPATSLRHTSTAMEETWDAHFENLDPARVSSLIEEVSSKLRGANGNGRVTVKGISQTSPGSYTVDLHAEGVEKKVYNEWLVTASYFNSTREQLKYNVPQAELTEGGLDRQTHVITRENRSLNRDGSWNEQITKETPIPSSLTYGAISGHSVTKHTQYRNQNDLPPELNPNNPTMEGSASRNEHGLIDATTVNSNDQVIGTARTKSALSSSETTSLQSTAIAPPDLTRSPGTIVSLDVKHYPDRKMSWSTTVEKGEPAQFTYTTTEVNPSTRESRTVTHYEYVNYQAQPNVPTVPTGQAVLAARVDLNRFGLWDASYAVGKVWDATMPSTSKSEDHYEVRVREVGFYEKDRTLPKKSYTQGKTYSQETTTLADGSKTYTTVETTAKEPHLYSFTSKQRKGTQERDITTYVFHNYKTPPTVPNNAEDYHQRCNELGMWNGSYIIKGAWASFGLEWTILQEDSHIVLQLETTEVIGGNGTTGATYANDVCADGVFWRIIAREIVDGVCDGETRAKNRYEADNRYPGGKLECVRDSQGREIYWRWCAVRSMGVSPEKWARVAMTPANLAKEAAAAKGSMS